MSRRKAAPKRKILPDPKYGNLKVAKFMNQIMKSGKKSLAESIVYGALNEIEAKSKKEPVEAVSYTHLRAHETREDRG